MTPKKTPPTIRKKPGPQPAKAGRPPQPPVRIVLVDDHPIIRAGVRACLETEQEMLVVGEAGSGLEAVRLVRKERPDLVMLDVMMPGMDGFAVLEKLRWTITGSRVLMFSAYNTADFILRALRLGAAGYLSKNSPPDEYIRAIRMVMQGVVYYSGDPSLVEHILKLRPDGRHPSGLSAPEIECLVWTAEGMTLEAVAASMKLTINQVRAVKHSLCKKTGFSDPARLTRFAAALGFINIQN